MGQPEKEPYFLIGAGRNENMGKNSGFTAVSHSRTTNTYSGPGSDRPYCTAHCLEKDVQIIFVAGS
jgi:hypothetical protein